jgi:UDP-N-acetylmuramate: L-alanyl-gamma-D-glutamyl-meso-diaminopimelate ligase
LYHGNVGLISGIAWDHINVFPTFESYKEQFRLFIDSLSKNGTLIYCKEDLEVKHLVEGHRDDLKKIPYGLPKHMIRNGQTILFTDHGEVALKIFGEHNLMNLEGARAICEVMGIEPARFYKQISSFKGASKRLELIASTDQASVYKDFAHSPSKLKATTEAVKKQFPSRPLVACMELHTFSSLNETFLNEYKGAMSEADIAYVYFNPHTIEHKKLKPITTEQVKKAFDRDDLKVYTSSKELMSELKGYDWKEKTLLLMTSGNFDGVDLNKFATELLEK